MPNPFFTHLQNQLSTQEKYLMRTPLFCVFERRGPDDPKDGAGWPTAIFLTDTLAQAYILAVKHRLRFPYIYVKGPGEDSELHCLLQMIRDGKLVERS